MTLGTGSTSSTLNFVKPDNSLYGSIVGNTSGLNIAGSGASSTVQINNFKTLNITGVDATSSVQISNITSLNAPGLATLTTSQVGTPLVLDSNNNIVKIGGNTRSLYLAGTAVVPQTGSSANIMTLYGQTNNGFFQNVNNNTVNTGTNYIIMFNPIVTNGNNTGHTAINTYVNWPTTTFTWHFGTATNTINHPFLVNNGYPLAKVTEGLISFPTTGLYKVTFNVWFYTSSVSTVATRVDLQLAVNYGYDPTRNDFIYFPNNIVGATFQSQFYYCINAVAQNNVGTLAPKPAMSNVTGVFCIVNDYLSSNPDRLWVILLTNGNTAISAYELTITKLNF